MATLAPGTLVEVDGLLAVVVAVDAAQVPEGHVPLWFGDPAARRRSEGGPGPASPEVWTVPIDVCRPAPAAVLKH
jgi:hypothetical protein